MTVACTLLGVSRGVRSWQDGRFHAEIERSRVESFPLRDLSKTLGEWQLREAGEATLAPEVARVAGCSDHVVRTYANNKTGVSVTVLILSGPSRAVSAHTPAACYPAAGYRSIDEPLVHPIASGSDRPPGHFRSEVYSRGEGASAERHEVYHAFRVRGTWVPDATIHWKAFRDNPWLYKIQTERRVAENERRLVDNPTEQFLGLLVPELERCLSNRSAHPAKEMP